MYSRFSDVGPCSFRAHVDPELYFFCGISISHDTMEGRKPNHYLILIALMESLLRTS